MTNETETTLLCVASVMRDALERMVSYACHTEDWQSENEHFREQAKDAIKKYEDWRKDNGI